MRLALALLGAFALLLTFAPVAQADHDECRISLADPTSPNWTEECEEPPEVDKALEQGHEASVIAGTSVEELLGLVEDETGEDAAVVCDEASGLCKTGIGVETSLILPPYHDDGYVKLLDTQISVEHPDHGERLEVTVPPS